MTLQERLDSIGDRVQTALGGFSPRDRALLGVMVGALLLLGGWFAVSAMQKAISRVEGNLATAEAAQEQVNSLLSRYTELQGDVAGLDARLAAAKDFAPSSWIEEIGNTMSISGNIKSIQERGNEETEHFIAQKLDLTIDDINLEQLVDLSFKFEKAPQAIRISELTAKVDNKDRTKLDVRMQIAVLRPLETITP